MCAYSIFLMILHISHIIVIIFYRCDPALWKINELTIEYVCINGFTQDLNNLNFTKSKRAYTKLYKGSTKTYYRYTFKY